MSGTENIKIPKAQNRDSIGPGKYICIQFVSPFTYGDGEQTRDFTYVENAVQVNIKGMLSKNAEAKNKVYNVAVGENFSINFLYSFIKDYLKSDIEPIHRDPREGDIRNSLADISLAKKLLGYQPTADFKTGLEKTIEFFKDLYSQK